MSTSRKTKQITTVKSKRIDWKGRHDKLSISYDNLESNAKYEIKKLKEEIIDLKAGNERMRYLVESKEYAIVTIREENNWYRTLFKNILLNVEKLKVINPNSDIKMEDIHYPKPYRD